MRAFTHVIVFVIVFWLLAIAARCQSAPECSTVTMDADGQLGHHAIPCADIPQFAHPWRVVPPPPPKPVGYWTFRRSWEDPPLRTNRQQLTSKAYLLSTIAGDTAVIVACSRRNSREDFHAEIPSALGVDFMAFLGGKFFTQSFAVGPQLYKIVHYSIAAAR